MSEPLIPAAFLFHFSVPLRPWSGPWPAQAEELPETHRLPHPGELDGQPAFGELRGGWSDQGLTFSLRVRGKRQPPWCREARFDESDGLQLWFDTRDTHTVHRAGRHCARFAFLPAGSGRRAEEPFAAWLPIHRAREDSRPAPPGSLSVLSLRQPDGYLLRAFVSARALTGYDPAEHPRLGFTFAVLDRELGWQTFSVGPEFPFQEDPSLWGTLELTGE